MPHTAKRTIRAERWQENECFFKRIDCTYRNYNCCVSGNISEFVYQLTTSGGATVSPLPVVDHSMLRLRIITHLLLLPTGPVAPAHAFRGSGAHQGEARGGRFVPVIVLKGRGFADPWPAVSFLSVAGHRLRIITHLSFQMLRSPDSSNLRLRIATFL